MGSGSLRCEICNGETLGCYCKGYMLCSFCKQKYEHIPDYIPISQWGKYAKIERRKRKMPLLYNGNENYISV